MRRGSPFHSRTSAACDSWEWRGWAGYLAASSYSLVPEMEYYAIRHSAGVLDVSPLYKYLIEGKDAAHLVNHVVTRDVSKLAKGQIYYTPWCDERGKTPNALGLKSPSIKNYFRGQERLWTVRTRMRDRPMPTRSHCGRSLRSKGSRTREWDSM